MDPCAAEIVTRVGMGEGCVTRRPEAVLVAPGLGSCVAVVVHSARPLVGGLAHVMLPRALGDGLHPFKFADTAVPALLRAFEEAGAKPAALVVYLVGGAAMFGLPAESALNVGERNVRAVREQLQARGIQVRAQAVGGHVSRTVSLHVASGRVVVRTAGGEEQEL